jgi:flagellar biosynthesis/type III secretory pathway protein FliH
MNSTPAPYSFPDPAKLAVIETASKPAATPRDDVALQEAIARGYRDGFARGEAAARLAAQEINQQARSQGFAAGRQEGFQQVTQAADALRRALVEFADFRVELVAQAESFCVELALAMAAKLVDVNQLRADFIRRTIHAAIKVLAPEAPRTIFVNPTDVKCAESAFSELPVRPDESIAPGGVRVEAGRLLVEGGFEQALEKIRASVFEARSRRAKKSD